MTYYVCLSIETGGESQPIEPNLSSHFMAHGHDKNMLYSYTAANIIVRGLRIIV